MIRPAETSRSRVPYRTERRAALRRPGLNFLILLCVGFIVVSYLVSLLSLSHRAWNAGIGEMLLLAVLFLVLDLLVYIRLQRPVREAVVLRTVPGITRALLTSAAMLALVLAIGIFFFATCYAMIRVF